MPGVGRVLPPVNAPFSWPGPLPSRDLVVPWSLVPASITLYAPLQPWPITQCCLPADPLAPSRPETQHHLRTRNKTKTMQNPSPPPARLPAPTVFVRTCLTPILYTTEPYISDGCLGKFQVPRRHLDLFSGLAVRPGNPAARSAVQGIHAPDAPRGPALGHRDQQALDLSHARTPQATLWGVGG